MFDQNISTISNFNKKHIYFLNNLNIYLVRDLLLFFPKHYLEQQNELIINQKCLFRCKIIKKEDSCLIVEFKGRSIKCYFFNNKIFKFLKINHYYNFIGVIECKNDQFSTTHPILVNYSKMVYYCSTINNMFLNKIILNVIEKIETFITYDAMDLKIALKNIHTGLDVERSLNFFKFLEALMLINIYNPNVLYDKLNLNSNIQTKFTLNVQQKNVVDTIFNKLNGRVPMKHIVFGEVGAGKTIIALHTIIFMAQSKQNIVLITPSLALSIQHADFLLPILKELNINAILYTSSVKNKNKIKKQIEDGFYQVIITTQAIFFTENIPNIGLIILDEMQKFGIAQFENFLNKCERRNALYLSATPLPRSMSMILNSFIQYNELPSFKPRNVLTYIIRDDLSIAYKLIDKKVYWVFPNIEEKDQKISIYEREESLSELGLNVVVLHGKMKDKDKIDVIDKFKNSQHIVLLTTSIIEIGIDIPDAGIMVIEKAYMFGLSQLHQMRGRIGRNGEKSMCFLLTNAITKKLHYFQKISTGKEIALKDMELRGSGRITGVEQSGFFGLRFLTNSDTDFIENIKKIQNNHLKDIKELKVFY